MSALAALKPTLLLVTALSALAAGPASAEQAWIRGGVRLNVRTEAGTQYRILGVVETGDPISIVRRGDGWTEIRQESGIQGWIPAGYLAAEPPASLRLVSAEEALTAALAALEEREAEAEALRERGASFDTSAAAHQEQIDRLERENIELRVGRWPEWVTGAAILAVGMIAGAILRSRGGRRASARIRL